MTKDEIRFSKGHVSEIARGLLWRADATTPKETTQA